jgi:hypothetical protein
MSATMTQPKLASHREELASVRGSQAKADLPPQVSASVLPELAEFAIKRGHGKALTAAGVLGLSESHLGRLVNDGDLKLKQLEALGPETIVTLATEMLKHYGPLATPKAQAKQDIREMRHILDELDQLLEHIA